MANRYQAPLALVRLALNQAAETSGARALPGYDEALSDLAEPILENASRFAGDVLSPLNPVGDKTPSHYESNGVITPPGFVEAYRRFREDGWVSLAAPEEYGGQGLSTLISAAVTEMWGGANLSFAMCPELTVGALGALKVHGTPQLIETYASHLASGEWATAMCLTEPQAGSDLSTLRTRAEPDGDAWRLFGRKIYISWGDHDLTENIVHFVLARTPDAPAGLKGISLFLVPKKTLAANGALTKNDIDAVSLEHKMGIRASPTCVMVLGEQAGARGWLVGRLHDGLGCMFTMMNHMRLGVGLHSLGLAERALQLARVYAHERLQGRKDLLAGQIAGGAEEYERVGFLRGCSLLRHGRALVPDGRRIPGALPRVCDWRNRPRRVSYSARTARSRAPAPARRRPPPSARSSALPPNQRHGRQTRRARRLWPVARPADPAARSSRRCRAATARRSDRA